MRFFLQRKQKSRKKNILFRQLCCSCIVFTPKVKQIFSSFLKLLSYTKTYFQCRCMIKHNIRNNICFLQPKIYIDSIYLLFLIFRKYDRKKKNIKELLIFYLRVSVNFLFATIEN